jgi:hypothetical protein
VIGFTTAEAGILSDWEENGINEEVGTVSLTWLTHEGMKMWLDSVESA